MKRLIRANYEDDEFEGLARMCQECQYYMYDCDGTEEGCGCKKNIPNAYYCPPDPDYR